MHELGEGESIQQGSVGPFEGSVVNENDGVVCVVGPLGPPVMFSPKSLSTIVSVAVPGLSITSYWLTVERVRLMVSSFSGWWSSVIETVNVCEVSPTLKS